MSGVKPITSYFKVLTKDELEIEELIESQSSILSKTISNQSARIYKTIVISILRKSLKSSCSTSNFSRSGRPVLPSILHGGIQPNRYSTIIA
jgi:hypothetical protein